ncbi:MAG TPA: hypothetical protein VK941_09690, partial [Gillisia sp.]|nr:hypothetical protein [Gillisia sp.]
MKYLGCLLLIILPLVGFSQTSITDLETYPVFSKCSTVEFAAEEACFKNTLKDHILENFRLPSKVTEENYNGEAFVLFEVDREGEFKVLYVDAIYAEIKEELVRVFEALPVVEPPTYNGRATYAQFRMPIKIPLNFSTSIPIQEQGKERSEVVTVDTLGAPLVRPQDEYDAIVSSPFRSREPQSNLNIPLSHERYGRFDAAMNRIGTNSHTASKPFLYKEVSPYYDFDLEREEMEKNASTWLGRKLWNEHLVTFQGENYWFTGDVILDLQLGKDMQSDYDFTYNNTRGAVFQGGLGKNLNFYTVVFESQGRFADYYNQYAESLAPFMGSGVAIIPGRGIAKEFMDGGYDYPVAEGYISYSPSEFFDIQLGHGNNFIGDGYRSLLMSDNPNPSPYLKLNTSFWKLKYTNTWMSLRDVREEVAGEGA